MMSTVFDQDLSNARAMRRTGYGVHPEYVDTIPVESECNAPPHFGTPFDPIVALHREEARAGMQMLAIVMVAALCGAAALVSTVITYVWMS